MEAVREQDSEVVHVTVRPKSKVFMAATRARGMADIVHHSFIMDGHGVGWSTSHVPEEVWATNRSQRCTVRYQPLGAERMDYDFNDFTHAAQISAGNYGFMLRDTDQGPTAYPQDFPCDVGNLNVPQEFYDHGFELFITWYSSDAHGNDIHQSACRIIERLGQDKWRLQVSMLPAALRNHIQPYDYLLHLAILTDEQFRSPDVSPDWRKLEREESGGSPGRRF